MFKSFCRNIAFLLAAYWLIAIIGTVWIGGWTPLIKKIVLIQLIPMIISSYTFYRLTKDLCDRLDRGHNK